VSGLSAEDEALVRSVCEKSIAGGADLAGLIRIHESGIRAAGRKLSEANEAAAAAERSIYMRRLGVQLLTEALAVKP